MAAVRLAVRRGPRPLRQAAGNNMLYAAVVFLAIVDRPAAGFFVVLLAIVLFLPSSGDPLTLAPAVRLNLWPLSRWQRYRLRLASLLTNPLSWLILSAMAWRRVGWGLWAVVAASFLCGFLGSRFRMPGIWVPPLPVGPLTHLIRKDLRQLLTALDFYCALLVVAPALYLRLKGQLPESAGVPLAALVVVILSTMALTLFGVDGESGIARYRLWAIPGWRIVAAKGAAYLLLILVLTTPFAPAAGLAGGLIALTVGQFVSVKRVIPQTRWRLRASHAFANGMAQMVLALFGFAAVAEWGVVWLAACVAAYAASLWMCGAHLAALRTRTAPLRARSAEAGSPPAGAG